MKEYNMQVKIRNNYLLTLMRERGIGNAAELARICDIGSGDAALIMGFKETPYRKSGVLRSYVERVCDALGVSVDALYPPQHLSSALETNISETELSFDDVQLLQHRPQNEESAEMLAIESDKRNAVDSVLSTLGEREESILRMRFYEGLTLDEVAERCGVTRGRIRQIEAKALRKLRHPQHNAALSAAFEI